MNQEVSFEDHVRYLSSHLRHRYDLQVQPGDPSDHVDLTNDEVCLRFYPGDVRDAFVVVYVSYTDATVLGPKRKSFELRRYVDYCDAREFFPHRYPPADSSLQSATHLGLNRDYCFIGSPFLIQEIIGFLIAHGEPVLGFDRAAVRALVDWIDDQTRTATTPRARVANAVPRRLELGYFSSNSVATLNFASHIHCYPS